MRRGSRVVMVRLLERRLHTQLHAYMLDRVCVCVFNACGHVPDRTCPYMFAFVSALARAQLSVDPASYATAQVRARPIAPHSYTLRVTVVCVHIHKCICMRAHLCFHCVRTCQRPLVRTNTKPYWERAGDGSHCRHACAHTVVLA